MIKFYDSSFTDILIFCMLQQFIPPYGTPPHSYVAMYPHGGIYAHPTMAPVTFLCFIFLNFNFMIFPFIILICFTFICHKFYQAPYPFSPYAMPSPNGVAEASVSIVKFDSFSLFILFSLM